MIEWLFIIVKEMELVKRTIYGILIEGLNE